MNSSVSQVDEARSTCRVIAMPRRTRDEFHSAEYRPEGAVVQLGVAPVFAVADEGGVSVGGVRSRLSAEEARQHAGEILWSASSVDDGPGSVLTVDDAARMARALGTTTTAVLVAFMDAC